MNSDNSHTERIRRMRERTLASWRRAALVSAATTGFYAPEQGAPPSGVDDSTRSARALGQKAYTIQLPGVLNGSSTRTIVPCCPP